MAYFNQLIGVADEVNVLRSKTFYIVIFLSIIVFVNCSIAIRDYRLLTEDMKKQATGDVAWQSICLATVVLVWIIPLIMMAVNRLRR